jgi:hypothetical protein
VSVRDLGLTDIKDTIYMAEKTYNSLSERTKKLQTEARKCTDKMHKELHDSVIRIVEDNKRVLNIW